MRLIFKDLNKLFRIHCKCQNIYLFLFVLFGLILLTHQMSLKEYPVAGPTKYYWEIYSLL